MPRLRSSEKPAAPICCLPTHKQTAKRNEASRRRSGYTQYTLTPRKNTRTHQTRKLQDTNDTETKMKKGLFYNRHERSHDEIVSWKQRKQR